MIDDIFVFDNVISPGYQDSIERYLKFGDWAMVEDVQHTEENRIKFNSKKSIGFSRVLVNVDRNIWSPNADFFIPIAHEAFAKIDYKIKDILAIRSFLTIPTPNTFNNLHEIPHVDRLSNHLVCLYYVVDSDGDTFLFDKSVNDVPESEITKGAELEIVKRVTPKKGRAILFNGKRYHAASRPSKDYRIILNFNVI